MSRPLRVCYPGAYYHVMNRGANRKSIFMNGPYDRGIFKNTLKDAVRKWKIHIHAFSLMENHYHLLIETPLGNLSQAMKHIDGLYTQRINRKYKRDGALLRGRFKSILVQKETYFLELLRYIHLNGVKAGLYKTPRHDFNCSHPYYLDIDKAPSWLDTQTGLSLFKNKTPDELDDFVHKGVEKIIEKTLSGKKWPAILGSKSFVKKIKEEFINGSPKIKAIPQQMELRKKKPLQITQIIRQLGRVYDLKKTDELLQTPKIKKGQREWKWALMVLLKELGQLSYQEIGETIGKLSEDAVGKFIKRYDFQNSERFSLIYKQLEKKMSDVRT